MFANDVHDKMVTLTFHNNGIAVNVKFISLIEPLCDNFIFLINISRYCKLF